jgi:hypothetical protein
LLLLVTALAERETELRDISDKNPSTQENIRHVFAVSYDRRRPARAGPAVCLTGSSSLL